MLNVTSIPTIPNEPHEVFEIRKKILESFDGLTFIESSHQYFLNGVELPSVSAVAHQFCQPFDTDAIAEKYAIKHGETANFWKDQWRYKSLCATTTGTLVHSYGESLGWLRNGHPELITDDNKCKYIEDKGWLIPTRKKEEAVLKFFDELDDNLHFVLAETKVYSGKNREARQFIQDYCGTFDLLMYYKHPTDDSKSGLVIMDYKTNAELKKEASVTFNKRMLEPFEDMYDEPLSTYTLQLNLYQIPLEDIGLKVIARRVIWLKEDGNYELIPLRLLTNELRDALCY